MKSPFTTGSALALGVTVSGLTTSPNNHSSDALAAVNPTCAATQTQSRGFPQTTNPVIGRDGQPRSRSPGVTSSDWAQLTISRSNSTGTGRKGSGEKDPKVRVIHAAPADPAVNSVVKEILFILSFKDSSKPNGLDTGRLAEVIKEVVRKTEKEDHGFLKKVLKKLENELSQDLQRFNAIGKTIDLIASNHPEFAKDLQQIQKKAGMPISDPTAARIEAWLKFGNAVIGAVNTALLGISVIMMGIYFLRQQQRDELRTQADQQRERDLLREARRLDELQNQLLAQVQAFNRLRNVQQPRSLSSRSSRESLQST